MSNKYNRISLPVELVKKLHDFITGLCIQITRRFISKNNRRPIYNGPGNGNTLTLSPGKLIRLVHTFCLLNQPFPALLPPYQDR